MLFIQKNKRLVEPQDYISLDRLVRMVFDKILLAKGKVTLLVHFPDVNKLLGRQLETDDAGV